MTPADLLRLSVTASAPPSPVTMTLLADAGPCRNCDGTGRVTLNTYTPSADAEVCDAAEATVAALWPQGDAPAGDECAAFSDVPLDTPMPPAFVEALASLSPAPSDLPDGDECFRTGDDAGRLRNLLAVVHRDGGHHVERVGIAQACVDAAARVLAAYGDAPQPAPLDFHGALAAVRNGRFVPPSSWVRCLACGGTRADVDGAPCEPCRGTGQQPPPLADRDLCPRCGALDLDHACPKSAATVAGEEFAKQHPEAAGRILG